MHTDLLIEKFKQKDVKAFETLYNMYHKSIHGVVYNIVRDSTISDELMQDVFIKAWKNADKYSSKKGRFFTWILNIARNTAIDKLRSKSFKQSKQNLNSDFFVDIITSNENLDAKTDAIGISKYVEQLGEKCKTIIEYLFFKGFTQKETAEAIDIPIGTVKTRNRNCVQQLRDMVL